MHPWRSWIILAILAAAGAQAATVYKWTDADGVVHYSDQPTPGATKIFTAGPGSKAGSSANSAPGAPAPAPPKPAPGEADHAAFTITSPGRDQTYFGDDLVNVQLALSPPLKVTQTLTWHLNGRQLDDQANSTQFVLPRLDRGAYTLAATLVDQDTGESKTTESVTFYVRQPSAQAPLRTRP